VNKAYLAMGALNVEVMGRAWLWLDTGTQQSLLTRSTFIGNDRERQGLKVACPEEIAYRSSWIDAEAVARIADAAKERLRAVLAQDARRESLSTKI